MSDTRGWQMANVNAVPHTGRKRIGYWVRRPRNAGVKRALLHVYDNLRGVSVPPDDFDDLLIASYGHRSWKRHRRTQWRGK